MEGFASRILGQPRALGAGTGSLRPGVARSTGRQQSPPTAASRLCGPGDSSLLRTWQGGKLPVRLVTAAERALRCSGKSWEGRLLESGNEVPRTVSVSRALGKLFMTAILTPVLPLVMWPGKQGSHPNHALVMCLGNNPSTR